MRVLWRRISSGLVIMSLLGLSGAALADSSLYSATLQVANNTFVVCAVTNVDKKPRQITAQILPPSGNDATDLSDCGVEQPGSTCAASATQDGGGSSAMYCKVTVKGPRKSVRAAFTIQKGSGPTRESTVVVPVE